MTILSRNTTWAGAESRPYNAKVRWVKLLYHHEIVNFFTISG